MTLTTKTGQSEVIGAKHIKTCNVCLVDKDLSQFYRHTSTKDRLHTSCKDCHNKESLTNYYKRGGYNSAQHYRSTYGITTEELERMKKAQNNFCAICKEEKRLVLDHNHANKRIRKLLCDKCNQGLGSFNDNSKLLIEAANYIEDNK